ncbi:MAG: NUDIX domain-containing protein [Actinomycetes bacterium]
MRKWLVAGGVIEGAALRDASDVDPSSLLMVRNVRPSGRADWTPPGGVIDSGEAAAEGLTREVFEETGLQVVSWGALLYEVLAEAPGLGWRLRVEVHRAEVVHGELSVGADPDGIVVGAEFVSADRCAEVIVSAPLWVREPLLDWLSRSGADLPEVAPTFHYLAEGDRHEALAVRRVG